VKQAISIVGLSVLVLVLVVVTHPQFSQKREAVGEVGNTLLSSKYHQFPIAACGVAAIKADFNHRTITKASEYMSEFGSGTSVFREIAEISARVDHECPQLEMVLDLAARSTSESQRIVALAESACRIQGEDDEAAWQSAFEQMSARATYLTVEEARSAQSRE